MMVEVSQDGTNATLPAPEPTIEWEPRTPKPSRFSRFMPGASGHHHHQNQNQNQDPERASDDTIAMEKEAGQRPPPDSSLYGRQQQQQQQQQHGNRLDKILPPHRKYLGMRRRVFLIAVTAAIIALLIIIIGLAAGLSSRSGGREKMPLPEAGADGKTYRGELTYYNPGLGACGRDHGDGDMVVAVAHELFDEAGGGGSGNPNNNPLCGKKIRVSTDGGRDSIEVTVVDRCEGCKPKDLDLSPSAFRKIAEESAGRVKGQWQWA